MTTLQVMEPINTKIIPKGENWLYQVKWDGIRGITYVEPSSYRLFTKKGNERTDVFQELKDLPKIIQGHTAILDGEIVVFDEENKPSFQRILHRERGQAHKAYYQKKYPAHYLLFDLLSLDGRDLKQLPLEERLQQLKSIVRKNDRILVTDDFIQGEALYDWVKEKGFEGIVAKKKESLYWQGKKHQSWYKIKLSKKILAVVGGLKYKAGLPNALLVGIYQDNQLLYMGKVAIGLTEKDKLLFHQSQENLHLEVSPFSNLVSQKECLWLKPLITCWISFMEWTNDGGLRHPKIIGFSSEKPEKANGSELISEE